MPKVLLHIVLYLCVTGYSAKAQQDSVWQVYGHDIQWRNMAAINTEGLEFSPAFYNNGLVYCSTGKNIKLNETAIELYYAEMIAPGKPTKAQAFSPQINSPLNEGPCTFDAYGRTMYFTRNNSQGGIQKADGAGAVRLQVFQADKGAYGWEHIHALSFNADEYSAMHPTLSEDGKRLYFASDMPGGYGGMDLYVSELSDTGWSHPQNLGTPINSDADEAFPSVFRGHWLFFASERTGTMGGFDIYLAELENTSFLRPLPAPFNSTYDDFGLVLQADATHGYLSSSRPGGMGGDDLYFFQSSEKFWTTITASEAQLEVLVQDFQSGEYLSDAHILITHLAQFGKEPAAYSSHEPKGGYELAWKTDGTGLTSGRLQRHLHYDLTIEKSGYQSVRTRFNLQRDTSITLSMMPESCKYYTLKVENAIQNSEYPYVTTARLKDTQEQETQSISSENHHLRICLSPGTTYELTLKAKGFETKILPLVVADFAAKDTLAIGMQPIAVHAGPIKRVEKGAVFVLDNIYYDFNKSAIRMGAAAELDELAALMLAYPDMEVLLISHTDARGKRKYNKQLSEERSQAAKSYLVAKGVQAHRITTEGRGEEQVRNECTDGVDCTAEQHAYNRRTEVLVTHFGSDQTVEFRYGKE